ncbi:hypothetical protein LTS15_007941 [Exophiala xenobiotica]|nr:hypothetical protein LTS15_007941 [Exophiala xenobiotica]
MGRQVFAVEELKIVPELVVKRTDMSPSTKSKDELRIFTPIGQLAQGFNEDIFWDTVESGCDAIICDSDLELFAKAAHLHNVPSLIGSNGGDGENAHVDKAAEIITEVVKRNGFRTLKVLKIYSEIPKDLVRQKLNDGLISPCGGGVPDLNEKDIDSSTSIVAQMGLEPYLKAMRENPDFDNIVGGRAYDPAPYAAFFILRGFGKPWSCLFHGQDHGMRSSVLHP